MCVKCGGSNNSKECKKGKETPAKCALCGGNQHTNNSCRDATVICMLCKDGAIQQICLVKSMFYLQVSIQFCPSIPHLLAKFWVKLGVRLERVFSQKQLCQLRCFNDNN